MNDLDRLMPIIEAHAAELKQPGVLTVRPGYRLDNGWPTKDPAIVVVTSPGADVRSLPDQIDGVKLDVRPATPVEQLRFEQPATYAKLATRHSELEAGAFPEVDPVGEAEPALAADFAELAAKPQIPYSGPAGASLQPVTGVATITCHASPDAGWPTLRAFLGATKSKLVVGLYDFTSAHILQEVEKDLAGAKQLHLTLDSPALNPTADQSDPDTIKALTSELGDGLDSAWALVRSNKNIQRWIYPTAYHIKVAVRDSQTVWLSSGNWNNSNQPDMDPINHPSASDQATARKSDRDWHVVIDQPELAKTFEAFLAHDLEVARSVAGGGPGLLEAEPGVAVPPTFQVEAKAAWHFFAPLEIKDQQMTITPLLTPDPDVYHTAMLALLQSAQSKLYIQLQYIHPSDDAGDADFSALVKTVVDKIAAGVDVRIITSEFQSSNGWLERLQSAGVDLARVKIQNGVHNKGFVVDSRVVALGSQNWSGDGVLRNRDATVIIDNAQAAAYYESIFVHDWQNVATQRMHQ